MTKPPLLMTVLMLAIFSTMVGIATTYPSDASFMIFVVGIPAIGLCLLQLGIDLYRRNAEPAADGHGAIPHAEDPLAQMASRRPRFDLPSENAIFTDTPHSPQETLRREIVVWGYFVALIASILLFGFHLTVPVFLITFLRFQAGATWRNAVLLGGGGAIVMFVLFEKVLRITLHPGFLTERVTDALWR